MGILVKQGSFMIKSETAVLMNKRYNKMYTVAVCDDEKYALEAIAGELGKIGDVENTRCFDNAAEFMESLDSGEKYDVALMDIDWKDSVNGIDYAAKMYRKSPHTKIIFVTGYSEQYIESVFMKKTNIEGYLSKPVTADKIKTILKKIESKRMQEEEKRLILKQRKDLISVKYSCIMYIESVLHHVRIHTVDNIIEVYSSMSDIMRNLPDNFCKCHKSYIVNMDYIKKLTKECIYIEDSKDTVPISRLKFKAVSEKFCEYVGENI